ncbi:MAG: N-6 DNA methylase [Deltaproteobacteria bacterium]|nr:N-6 DNA methylase [Deltaproteobacteria bacterium]
MTNSVATCQWSDDTFNGDLLPLSRDYITAFEVGEEQTKGKIFLHLQAILKGWTHISEDDSFQLTIDWGDLDFAHIPVGVLSQVYENFSRIWDGQQAEQTSVFYTPNNIAKYLVDDGFEGIPNKKEAHILDPSCGAGIFLVLAFRKLVATRWKEDGKRPNTQTIQNILYNQLCGFDISESALRLAALSLYITAIELNGAPHPPKSLKFPKPLKNKVLFNLRRTEEMEERGFILGSLRSDLPDQFNSRFDLVIGNPPWSRLKGDDPHSKKKAQLHNVEFTKTIRHILRNRGLDSLAEKYNNPDNNPDLPFLWKATQWAKPQGVIALALHGRIFLKQSPAGIRAFQAILQGIKITGILNGSNLSDTAVWPGMNQPFMLFFAKNCVPENNQLFHFVTPHYEPQLNNKGRIRIDYQSAHPICGNEVHKKPQLLKTLALGTTLDVDVIQKVDEQAWPTVQSYWEGQGFYSGLGYNRSPKQKQYQASFLQGLPDFRRPDQNSFTVNVASLPKCKLIEAHMPRCPELYRPPLLIIPQSPRSSLSSPKSFILNEAVAFNQSFYGFSMNVHPDATAVFCLHLLTHSELFAHRVLMTSSRMGAERRTFLKQNIEQFPFPEVDSLPKKIKSRATELSHQLETAADKPWNEINDFIFDLYELDEYDRQVVRDTLAVAQPYKEFRTRAITPPTQDERTIFHAELYRFLAPSFEVTHESLQIQEQTQGKEKEIMPWHFFSISTKENQHPVSSKKLISLITEQANQTGCSRAVIHENGILLIGIIGQYRYWTPSRARLCALDIIRHHLDLFPVRDN